MNTNFLNHRREVDVFLLVVQPFWNLGKRLLSEHYLVWINCLLLTDLNFDKNSFSDCNEKAIERFFFFIFYFYWFLKHHSMLCIILTLSFEEAHEYFFFKVLSAHTISEKSHECFGNNICFHERTLSFFYSLFSHYFPANNLW